MSPTERKCKGPLECKVLKEEGFFLTKLNKDRTRVKADPQAKTVAVDPKKDEAQAAEEKEEEPAESCVSVQSCASGD